MNLLFYLIISLTLTVSIDAFNKITYPGENWRKCSFGELEKLNKKKLGDLFNYAFDANADYETNSLILYYRDCEVRAQFANGYKPKQLHRVVN